MDDQRIAFIHKQLNIPLVVTTDYDLVLANTNNTKKAYFYSPAQFREPIDYDIVNDLRLSWDKYASKRSHYLTAGDLEFGLVAAQTMEGFKNISFAQKALCVEQFGILFPIDDVAEEMSELGLTELYNWYMPQGGSILNYSDNELKKPVPFKPFSSSKNNDENRLALKGYLILECYYNLWKQMSETMDTANFERAKDLYIRATIAAVEEARLFDVHVKARTFVPLDQRDANKLHGVGFLFSFAPALDKQDARVYPLVQPFVEATSMVEVIDNDLFSTWKEIDNGQHNPFNMIQKDIAAGMTHIEAFLAQHHKRNAMVRSLVEQYDSNNEPDEKILMHKVAVFLNRYQNQFFLSERYGWKPIYLDEDYNI